MKPVTKTTMRVSTVFTGVAAAATAFGPAAQAAPANNPPVPQPYSLYVNITPAVYRIQVCAYKSHSGKGIWTCSPISFNYNYGIRAASKYFSYGWRRGKVNVWVWSAAGHEWGHTCNTNGSYHGIISPGIFYDKWEVTLSAGYRNPLGLSTKEC